MSNEKMREIFEAAYMRDLAGSSTEDAPLWLERGSDGEYRSFQARGAWWAWQASRAAIEVDLSTLTVTHDTDTNHEPCGDDLFYEDEVKTLIESLGLKVKP